MTLIQDELLDLVDASDRVIRQEWRSVVQAQKLNNFRAVNAFLKNKEGKLWIPLRSPHKRVFASCLDCSMGGHVGAGETYQEAFAREMQEELNLDVTALNVKFMGKFNSIEHGISCFTHVYEIEMDESPDYNPIDYVSYEWLSPAEVIAKIENGAPAKGDLIKFMKLLYLKQ